MHQRGKVNKISPKILAIDASYTYITVCNWLASSSSVHIARNKKDKKTRNIYVHKYPSSITYHYTSILRLYRVTHMIKKYPCIRKYVYARKNSNFFFFFNINYRGYMFYRYYVIIQFLGSFCSFFIQRNLLIGYVYIKLSYLPNYSGGMTHVQFVKLFHSIQYNLLLFSFISHARIKIY